jgi:hypothetical protein
MCRRVECRQCARPTYAGCGMHVEQVLGDVPKAERCRCREAKPRTTDTKPQAPTGSRSWLAGLLRK